MLVIDLEYTGIDAERHSLISLGAVDYLDPSRSIYLECRIRPGAEFDEEAFAVHGLTREYLETLSLTEEQLLRQFDAWARESPSRVLMGHLPRLDWNFLTAGYARYGMEWEFGYRPVDSHSVAIMHMYSHKVDIPMRDGLSALTLDAIASYVGLHKRNGSHNALFDAKLTAECFARLLENKTLLPEFAEHKIPVIQKKFGSMF